MDYAEQLAKENQCEYLILEVIKENERVKRLYQEKGFQLINELAVGSVVLPTITSKNESTDFKAVSLEERALSETKWIPWQNRSIFSDQNYDIYHEEIKVGSISFNLVEEASGKNLILKQLQLVEQKNYPLITAILLTLKEQENLDTIKFTNFDKATPEYTELEKIGITLQLTQLQLVKKI